MSEEQSACADDTADGNQQQVVDGKTCDCARYAAEAVEQRNRNGHIRAAYSDCKYETEERGKQRHESDKETDCFFNAHRHSYAITRDAGKSHDETEHGQKLMTFVDDGFLRQNLMEFARRNETAE